MNELFVVYEDDNEQPVAYSHIKKDGLGIREKWFWIQQGRLWDMHREITKDEYYRAMLMYVKQ